MDETGTITDKYLHAPFGELLSSSGSSRTTYIGKEKDTESGFGDFGVRKYSDAHGQFMQTEPLWDKYLDRSIYSYCGNDPVSRNDRSGYEDDGFSFVAANIVANCPKEVADKFFENNATIGLGVLGFTSAVLTGGAGLGLASGGGSTLTSLGGVGMSLAGGYGVIATPIKVAGDLTGNASYSNLPATATGVLGSVVDSYVGNGKKTFEKTGDVVQNFAVGLYDFTFKANSVVKLLDAQQFTESVGSTKKTNAKNQKKEKLNHYALKVHRFKKE